MPASPLANFVRRPLVSFNDRIGQFMAKYPINAQDPYVDPVPGFCVIVLKSLTRPNWTRWRQPSPPCALMSLLRTPYGGCLTWRTFNRSISGCSATSMTGRARSAQSTFVGHNALRQSRTDRELCAADLAATCSRRAAERPWARFVQ